MYLSLIGWRLASREDMYIVRAPDFILAKKHFRKCRFFLDLDIRRVRRSEEFHGRLKPWLRVTKHKKWRL